MVLCIFGNCGSKSGRDSIRVYSVSAIITNQGEEFEELTREWRNLWISAIGRADLKTKNVLQNERVCSRHFVSGRPAANWERFSGHRGNTFFGVRYSILLVSGTPCENK